MLYLKKLKNYFYKEYKNLGVQQQILYFNRSYVLNIYLAQYQDLYLIKFCLKTQDNYFFYV